MERKKEAKNLPLYITYSLTKKRQYSHFYDFVGVGVGVYRHPGDV